MKFFDIMKFKLTFLFSILFTLNLVAQTKVSGHVFDEYNDPVSFVNVFFKDSSEGTSTNENGKFYLESDQDWSTLIISFIGFKNQEITLDKKVTYDLKIILSEEAAQLDAVVLISGKQPKKNNPAIEILKKIWSHKRKNGLKNFNQYKYDKYEKVEFDINTIDSALIKSKLFSIDQRRARSADASRGGNRRNRLQREVRPVDLRRRFGYVRHG